jgi:hypothetical protein
MKSTAPSLPPWIALYCWAAGGVDLVTGLLLVAAPLWTLQRMGVPAAAVAEIADPIFLRYLGPFVAGVGSIYWLALRPGTPVERTFRIASALEATAVVRLFVASFLVGALARDALAPQWGVVLFTDLSLGLFQLVLLGRARLAVRKASSTARSAS